MKKHLLKLPLIIFSALVLLATFITPAFADTVSTYESSTAINGIDVFYGPYWRAQTFQPDQTHTITSVQLPLINRGNTAGDIIVSIKATDASGRPTGQDLASGSMPVASISTAWSPATWYTFNLGAGCIVEQGKTYAIVWRAPSASSMFYWMNMSGSYSKGQVMASNSGNVWTNLSIWDAGFRESGVTATQPPPVTTAPSPTTTTPSGTVSLFNSITSFNGNDVFYGSIYKAQTFQPSQTHTITSIQMPLLIRGTGTGNVIVSIRATDASGRPSGPDLASGSIPVSSIINAWSPTTWYTFNLGAGCVVEQGKTYAIVWRAPSTTTSGLMFYWMNMGNPYAGGQVMTSVGGTSWINSNGWDAAFREYGVSGTQPSPTPTTPPPSPTTTTTPPPPTTTTTGTGGLRHTGWISVYAANNPDIVPWNQLSALIYQNVYLASSSNPTLLLQGGYSWSQLSNLAAQANAHGVPILACLWGGGDPAQNDMTPVLRNIIANPTLKQQLFNNLNALCNQYNLAGIAIDWEGSYPDPQTYANFLKDMRAALGSKLITPIGSWTEVSINSSAAPYIDWLSLMSYDYWIRPYYGTLAQVQQTVNNWINAGWPKNKIDIGIEFLDMSGAWSPIDVITAKAAWAKSFGLGGAWGYLIDYQQRNNMGQLQAIYNGLGGIISQ